MFTELDKYKNKGNFLFTSNDELRLVCNAPADRSGIYLIYALTDEKKELTYIGCSGKIKPDGSLFIRKAGLGGIKDRLVNGKQFGEPRRITWPKRMQKEEIKALDIHWYVTHDREFVDCPKLLEHALLLKYVHVHGRLPKWNLEL